MRCLTACLAILLPALALPAAPQQKQEKQEELPTIKVDVDVVNLLFTVRDKRGALMPNLTKDDFAVYEDGKPQEVRYFNREIDLPLTIGLLVDVSVSQGNLIEVERRGASQFFSQVLRPKDMAFLISFGAEAELLQDLTNSPKILRNALDELRVNAQVGGLHPGPVPTANKPHGTILFDAVYLAATEKLKGEVGRKAVVLITDGVDQGSHYSRDEAIASAHRSDAIIYSILYYDPSFYGFFGAGGEGENHLRHLSEDTGGRVFHVNKKHPLPEAFDQIQQEMRSQYAIGYTPTTPRDGAFHKIEIRPKNRDLKVQARKGYYAVARDSK